MSNEIKKTTDVAEPTEVVAEPTEATATPATPVDDALSAKIRAYGGDDAVIAKIKDLGAETVEDLTSLEESDLTGAGLKLVKARKMLSDLQTAKKAAEPATATPTMAFAPDYSILPTVPSDESLLKSLRTGGVLKVDDSAYNSALRVFLADRCGLFRIPEMLAAEMEKFADENEEPVTPLFFKLKKQITRREYGDLFAAIDGLDGAFATKKRREEFLRRMRNEMCPAIREAYQVLDAWYQSFMATSSDPGAMMTAIYGLMNGTGTALASANVPPVDGVRDAADTLKDAINHVFRGTGVPVASAMAYDAMEISKTLENGELPAMLGVANREQMLKKLGVNITPNYARLEQNLVRFVLSYIKYGDDGTDNDVAYLTALWTLGNQINWTDLVGATGTGVATIGGKHVL
jgi:hypothetical protein